MNALRYLLASAALGLIAVWASENMFWVAPPEALNVFELAFVWLAYSFCTASALSAVVLTGVRGLRAAFLGAAVMGWLVEGVIVGEMYLEFPFQLIWTPLAWHALISGVCVFALGRASVHWSSMRQAGAYGLLGVFIGYWAQYWPTVRNDLPGTIPLLVYLAGLGVFIPLAQMLLDRLTPLIRPPLWVMLIAPIVLAVLWGAQSIANPSVVRLALPVLLVLTLWMMKRLGAGRAPVDFGPPALHPTRHFMFLLAPLIGVPLAVAGWDWTGGHEANVAVASLTVLLSLLAYAVLLLRAIRSKRG